MKPINVALCSFGMSGEFFHAPFLHVNSNFNFYAVYERTKQQSKVKYPNIKIYRSLESMLLDPIIELVIVNTPNVTHFDFTKKALNAGKHVVVEKPFTATVTEANELIKLAQDKNRLLSVYHNRRYDSDFKTVKKIINNQILGSIVDMEIRYDRYVPELSYKTHKETPSIGVGGIYDLGSHIIDQALNLFGLPDAIFADLDTIRPNSKVNDYFDIKLFYKNHRVLLKSSYFVKETLPAYAIHGTIGSFIKTKADVQEQDLISGKLPNIPSWGIEPTDETGLLHTTLNGKTIRQHFDTLNGNYMDFYNAIYDAIRLNKSNPVTAEEAKNVIKVIELAIKSNDLKQVIPFN